MFFRFFCNREKVFAITPKEIHGSISLAGYKYKRDNWINQDAFLVESSMTKNDSGDSGDQTLIAAVMDGHGQNGHLVSNYCSTRLIPLLAELESSLSDHHSRSPGTYSSSSSMEKMFETMHGEVESKMDEKVSNTSGTTMTIVHIANGCIQALNVGDSPAYLGRRKEVNGGLELIQLTLDHKPELDGESKRIKDAGGRVYARPVVDNESNKVELGPMRVWYQCDKKDESKTIGLAMTRSLGDVLAHQVGVSSKPYFCLERITSMDEFVILGSDGLTDALGPNEIITVVEEYMASLPPESHKMEWDPQELAQILTSCARRNWQSCRSIDDITCCVIKLKDTDRCFFTT